MCGTAKPSFIFSPASPTPSEVSQKSTPSFVFSPVADKVVSPAVSGSSLPPDNQIDLTARLEEDARHVTLLTSGVSFTKYGRKGAPKPFRTLKVKLV